MSHNLLSLLPSLYHLPSYPDSRYQQGHRTSYQVPLVETKETPFKSLTCSIHYNTNTDHAFSSYRPQTAGNHRAKPPLLPSNNSDHVLITTIMQMKKLVNQPVISGELRVVLV